MAEDYASWSPYNYVMGNPVMLVDPDGRAPEDIIGKTRNDAKKVHDDLNEVFAGDQFSELRSLFTRGKKGKSKKFDKIDKEALSNALSGLGGDDLALAQNVTDAINSDDKHVVEFVDINAGVSTEGSAAIKGNVAAVNGPNIANAMFPNETIPAKTIYGLAGDGINAPTKNGSHSVIVEGSGVSHLGNTRALTTVHEAIGHGVAAANNVLGVPNNTRAIRVENLTRRVMGLGGARTEHGGGSIIDPNALPLRIGN